MNSVVLDASGGVEIVLRTLPGRRLAKLLIDQTVYVPETFYSEVAGVLRRQVVRGEIADQRAIAALDRLLAVQTAGLRSSR